MDDMNRLDMTFGVHVGDIWGGNTSCSESRFRDVREDFDSFEQAFVYTPGDNEWKDCTSTSGKLSLIRKLFFPDNQTRGESPITVSRQSSFPENARFVYRDVVFFTANEPGSSGASGSQRDANVAWLHAAFDLAEDIDAKAVMALWQDNSFRPSGGALYRALEDRTVEFGRPVTLVHGDTHDQKVDHPWSDVDNFTRVEVFGGSSNGDWIRARIDPGSEDVFSFSIERP